MSDIKQETLNEKQPIPVSIEGTKKILSQMEKCNCIIYPENGKKGTGFICKIPFLGDYLPVLITNNHVLNENDIENNKIIKLIINEDVKNIIIDNLRKKYTNSDENIDITIIQIKPQKDKIYNYLELDENEINKNKERIELENKKKSIYILHYPKGKLSVSYGIMENIINSKNIYHYCNTEEGSSGGPILSLETYKVIGVHFGYKNIGHSTKNCGTFIKYIIDLDLFKSYNKNENKIIYKNDKNKYEIGKKEINKNSIYNRYKSKKKSPNLSNCNKETFKLNDTEKNYKNYKYNKKHTKILSKNNNTNSELVKKNHRTITDPNPPTITDINNLRKNNINSSRNHNKKYYDHNINKIKKKNNFNNDIEFKNLRKMNNRNFPNNRIQSGKTDFKSQNQNIYLMNLPKNEAIKSLKNSFIIKHENKIINITQMEKREEKNINKSNIIKDFGRKKFEGLYSKKNKIMEMINSFTCNDNRRNKISDNYINSFSSKKEFNNKKFNINLKKLLSIKKLESKKEFLELDLDEISNKDTNLNKLELNSDNKNIHLKEDRKRRMLSESIEKKKKRTLSIKNNTYNENTKNFKNNKISLNQTIEKNNLDRKFFYLNKEETGENQSIEKNNKENYNIIFNRTGTNFNNSKKLIEYKIKLKDLKSFHIKVDKSQRISYKQMKKIKNKVSLYSDEKEKIDKNNNLVKSPSCKNFSHIKIKNRKNKI